MEDIFFSTYLTKEHFNKNKHKIVTTLTKLFGRDYKGQIESTINSTNYFFYNNPIIIKDYLEYKKYLLMQKYKYKFIEETMPFVDKSKLYAGNPDDLIQEDKLVDKTFKMCFLYPHFFFSHETPIYSFTPYSTSSKSQQRENKATLYSAYLERNVELDEIEEFESDPKNHPIINLINKLASTVVNLEHEFIEEYDEKYGKLEDENNLALHNNEKLKRETQRKIIRDIINVDISNNFINLCKSLLMLKYGDSLNYIDINDEIDYLADILVNLDDEEFECVETFSYEDNKVVNSKTPYSFGKKMKRIDFYIKAGMIHDAQQFTFDGFFDLKSKADSLGIYIPGELFSIISLKRDAHKAEYEKQLLIANNNSLINSLPNNLRYNDEFISDFSTIVYNNEIITSYSKTCRHGSKNQICIFLSPIMHATYNIPDRLILHETIHAYFVHKILDSSIHGDYYATGFDISNNKYDLASNLFNEYLTEKMTSEAIHILRDELHDSIFSDLSQKSDDDKSSYLFFDILFKPFYNQFHYEIIDSTRKKDTKILIDSMGGEKVYNEFLSLFDKFTKAYYTSINNRNKLISLVNKINNNLINDIKSGKPQEHTLTKEEKSFLLSYNNIRKNFQDFLDRATISQTEYRKKHPPIWE